MDSRAILQGVIQGQAERNILEISIGGYLSKMKVITELLNIHEDIRREALVLDADGLPLKYTGN
jgi:hypothetical protein